MRKFVLHLATLARTSAATLFVAVLLAACTDSPTAPGDGGISAENWGPSKDYVLEPIIVIGTPRCNPYLSANFCQGPGTGTCITSEPGTGGDPEYVGIASCPGEDGAGGSGDGGTAPPPPATVPPPTEPTDTCNTADQIVNDPQVSEGLQDLWARSNPDANLAQRRETAGWIVEYPAGQFSIVPITTTSSSFGCADFTVQFPAQGTVVGFVHTHPYQVDETILDCQFTNVQDYTGAPSDADRVASKALGSLLGRSGPLPGYIIDKDGYYRFEGSQYTATPRLPRCGY